MAPEEPDIYSYDSPAPGGATRFREWANHASSNIPLLRSSYKYLWADCL
jgi:hypothetical protein